MSNPVFIVTESANIADNDVNIRANSYWPQPVNLSGQDIDRSSHNYYMISTVHPTSLLRPGCTRVHRVAPQDILGK